MKMPFGKFEGVELCDIDDDGYLAWVRDECCEDKPTLRQAIEQRLGFNGSIVPPIVSDWYRTLALEFHPDHAGGDCKQMQAINRARDLLLEMLEPAEVAA